VTEVLGGGRHVTAAEEGSFTVGLDIAKALRSHQECFLGFIGGGVRAEPAAP
jgi:hypothetical protein